MSGTIDSTVGTYQILYESIGILLSPTKSDSILYGFVETRMMESFMDLQDQIQSKPTKSDKNLMRGIRE